VVVEAVEAAGKRAAAGDGKSACIARIILETLL
jgi:hypothetical protein